jgi:hypothetical protein
MDPAAVLALGDVQYENGEYDNFLHFYAPSWGRLKAITHPVAGNHEYGMPNARGYFDYFDGAGRKTGRAGARGAGWYAFDVGAWRLYAMNSNCGAAGGCGRGSAQLRWLRADLAAHPRRCTLMYMHHPMFASDTRSRSEDTPALRALLRPLWQAFYDRGGDVVLAAHTHFYERLAPQDPREHLDPAHGIREFIAGTGGRNHEQIGKAERTSQVRNDRAFGVLRLDLHPKGYDWRFVPVPGEGFTDAGSGRCHR